MITTVRDLPVGRQIKDAARFAEVRSVELHGALTKRRIDISEIDRIPQLVISRRLRHVASPEIARERDSVDCSAVYHICR